MREYTKILGTRKISEEGFLHRFQDFMRFQGGCTRFQQVSDPSALPSYVLNWGGGGQMPYPNAGASQSRQSLLLLSCHMQEYSAVHKPTVIIYVISVYTAIWQFFSMLAATMYM